jgi:hypothetical protein
MKTFEKSLQEPGLAYPPVTHRCRSHEGFCENDVDPGPGTGKPF